MTAIQRKKSLAIAFMAALAIFVGLGASRLTYHEAIWAQSAREMLASGLWLIPTLDGRPWLEKPPLGTWLIAASSTVFGRVDESAARLPSALAAIGLCLGVGTIASRRFGPSIGLYAGLVQATTLWTVLRGRLAEADLLLAAMIVGLMAVFDAVRMGSTRIRGAFFVLIGLTSLVKGIGFGAVLVGATVLALMLWDRDRATFRAMRNPAGLLIAVLISLIWPLLVLARHAEALQLWTLHVTDRLATHPSQFAGESWGEYVLSPLWQTLPWTPLALFGAWISIKRAIRERFGADRLLCAWAVVPMVLVSLASVRNGHYLIHALPAWSIWAAIALDRLQKWRETSPERFRFRLVAICGTMSLFAALGFQFLVPRLDHRTAEWAFYRHVGRTIPSAEPLILLYDDWDRLPYPSPFGPMPHDLAARLFYLDRPASWRASPDDLIAHPPTRPFAVLGRERDFPALRKMGRVEMLSRGPILRAKASKVDDRAYVLFRVVEDGVGDWGSGDGDFRVSVHSRPPADGQADDDAGGDGD